MIHWPSRSIPTRHSAVADWCGQREGEPPRWLPAALAPECTPGGCLTSGSGLTPEEIRIYLSQLAARRHQMPTATLTPKMKRILAEMAAGTYSKRGKALDLASLNGLEERGLIKYGPITADGRGDWIYTLVEVAQ